MHHLEDIRILVRTGLFWLLFTTHRIVLLIPKAPDVVLRRLMARYDHNILKFIPIKFHPKISSFDMVRTLVFEALNSRFLLGFDTFSYL